MSTIPLAKTGPNFKKMDFPAYGSEKLDGVPIRIDFWFNKARVQTRQGKPCPSVSKIVDALRIVCADLGLTPPDGSILTLIGEVTCFEPKSFKDTSGIVRRQTPQDGLVLNLFDAAYGGMYEKPFGDRIMNILWPIHQDAPRQIIRVIPQHYLLDEEDATEFFDRAIHPDMEGAILRSESAPFKPGSRHWDYQKWVVDPTVDLLITGYAEAVDKHGEPMQMVGRVLAQYKGAVIGIGPGKMTHEERAQLWQTWDRSPVNRIATIKYKRDPTYTALRQPTFQHWREDKDVPDF